MQSQILQSKDAKSTVKPKATKAMRLKQIQIKFDNLYSPQAMNFKKEFKYETNIPKPRVESIINKGAGLVPSTSKNMRQSVDIDE